MKGFIKWMPAGFVAVVVLGFVMLAGWEPYMLHKLPISLEKTMGDASVMKGMGITGHILDQEYDIFFSMEGESGVSKKKAVPRILNQERAYYQTNLVYPVLGAKKKLVKENTVRDHGITSVKQQYAYDQIHIYPGVSLGNSSVTLDAEFIVDCQKQPYMMTTQYEKSDTGSIGSQTIIPGNLDGTANNSSDSASEEANMTEDHTYFYNGYNLSALQEEQYVVLTTNEYCRGSSGIYHITDWLYQITPFSQYLNMLYSGNDSEVETAVQMKAEGIWMGYEKVADIPLLGGRVIVLGLASTENGHVVLVLQRQGKSLVPACYIYEKDKSGHRKQVEFPIHRKYTNKSWKKANFQLFQNGNYLIVTEKSNQTDKGIMISVLDVSTGDIVNQQTIYRDHISSLEDVYYQKDRLYLITQEYAEKLDLTNPVSQGDGQRMLQGFLTVWADKKMLYEAEITNNLEEDYRTKDWMPGAGLSGSPKESAIYPRVMFLLRFDRNAARQKGGRT